MEVKVQSFSPPLQPCPPNTGRHTLSAHLMLQVTGQSALTRQLLLLSRVSRVRLSATPWITAYQAPPSMGFSRQGYWSGVASP